jgi:uncharacterized protein (TIGR03067 family)
MKRFAVALGLMSLAFLGVLSADEKDLKELEGTYSVTSLEKAGAPAPKELTQKMKVQFKGEVLTIMIGEEEKKAKIVTDATKTPHTIDISPTDGEKGKMFPGIYKMEKGELSIAFTEKGDRPKDLKSDGEVILMKLKKDEKK